MKPDVRESLSELDSEIGGLMDAIEALPPQLQRPAEWGPREMLVHIVFAHELYVSYLRAIAAGEKPPLFEGRYVDQNARALAENARVGVPALADRLRAAHSELSSLVVLPAVEPVPFYFKLGAKRRTLVQALDAVIGHVRGHAQDIRRLGWRHVSEKMRST